MAKEQHAAHKKYCSSTCGSEALLDSALQWGLHYPERPQLPQGHEQPLGVSIAVHLPVLRDDASPRGVLFPAVVKLKQALV